MEQDELFMFVVDVLERAKVQYMVAGSYASSVYGDPRFTRDIDIVIQVSPMEVQNLCNAFPMPEFYVSWEAAAEAVRLRSQFNVLHPDSGNKIDFILTPANQWGREQIARRQQVRFLTSCLAFTASPEDIIISKMLYYQEGGSEKHLRDIAAMFSVRGSTIDRTYIEKWMDQFDLNDIWQAILARLS